MKKFIMAILLIVWCAPLQAATHYIDDAGTDAGDCTNGGSPCRTFAYALAAVRFAAGDTLIVKDGTYSISTNGNGTRFINLRCDNGQNNNGTAGAVSTIRAENERQAFLSQNGVGASVFISNCDYWSIEGLRSQTGDFNGNLSERHFLAINGSDNISFKRNLVVNSNRYRNEGMIIIDGGTNGLLEENEIYSFHRNGMGFSGGHTGGIARRNYANSRSYADIPNCGAGCSAAIDSSRGDDAFLCYPCSNTIFENNISENSAGGFTIQAAGASSNVQFLGNIDIGSASAYHSNYRTNGVQNVTLKDNLGQDNTSHAFYMRSEIGTVLQNNTAYNASNGGFVFDRESAAGSLLITFNADSLLSTEHTGLGYWLVNTGHAGSWLLDYTAAFNNAGGGWSPAATHANITNELTADPQLGSCRAWIPASATNIKGQGKNGKDFGANILYKYLNGVLTSEKLWNTSTNDFLGCGVVVAGVNDVAGTSCTNVDIRLNIGTANGCAFPAGYSDTGPPSAGGEWVATDNFDAETLGDDLNGKSGGSGWAGNWTQNTAAMIVATAPAGGQGGKAILINADPDASYSRQFTDLSAGLVSFRFWQNTNAPADAIFFVLDEGTTGRGLISIDPDGNVKIFDGTSRFNIGPYLANTWNTVTLHFNQAEQPNKFQAKLNNGNFTQWFPAANGGTYTVVNRVRIKTEQTTLYASQIYIDDIKEGSGTSILSTISLVDTGLASHVYAGETRKLEWSSENLTGNVDLLASDNGGYSYRVIALAVPNTCSEGGSNGCYFWTIRGPASPKYRIRIRSSSNHNVYDDSALFSIGGSRLTLR